MLKITLKDVRERRGYTKNEVARHCGIMVETYHNIEINPSKIPLSIASKIALFLGVQLSIIFPGSLEDCIKHNRIELIEMHSLTTHDHILTTQSSK